MTLAGDAVSGMVTVPRVLQDWQVTMTFSFGRPE